MGLRRELCFVFFFTLDLFKLSARLFKPMKIWAVRWGLVEDTVTVLRGAN